MARSTDKSGNEVKSEGPKKAKGTRSVDDLDLIRAILEENPRLKARVMYLLESSLNKPHTN
jgi:hypothetical protein